MGTFLKTWLACKNAATAIEYGLIAGGIALVIMTAVLTVGDKIAVLFTDSGSAMQRVVSGIDDHSAR